jgi:hypothetical protein
VAACVAAGLVTPAVVIAVAGGLGAVAALVLEARSHNAGPGNGERVRTPLKSMCRALRFP